MQILNANRCCIFIFIYYFLLNIIKTDTSDLKSQKDTCTSAYILVGTIDGHLHALGIENSQINRLWTIDTGPMIHSSVKKLELLNEDNSLVRIIPSLDGNLYKYFTSNDRHQEYIEKIPFNMEELLKKSIKINQDMTFIGGMMTHTLGIDTRNGQMLYNCTTNGCDFREKVEFAEEVNDLLVIKQYKHVLCAVSVHNGVERWNLSLSKNEILLHPKCNSYQVSSASMIVNNLANNLSFDVSKGIVKFNKYRFKLGIPIVSCDLIFNGLHRSLNIFHKRNQNKLHETTELVDKSLKSNGVYIGKYNSQYYAQVIDTFISLNSTNNLKQNLLKFERKLLSTKSTLTYLSKEPSSSESQDTNKNALILFRENPILDQLRFLTDDHEDNDDGNTWFFIEQPKAIITINNIQITYGQIFSIFVTIFMLILTSYFFQRRLVSKRLQASLKLVKEASNFQIKNEKSESKSDCQTETNDKQDEAFKSKYMSEFDHVRLIGKGGFGHVFEAKHKIDERLFAIKRIKLRNNDEKEKVSREVRTLAKLENPFIVRYFYSWFEHPPIDWQEAYDKILLRKEPSIDKDYEFSSSEFSNQISSPTNTSFTYNQRSTTSSSSSIVFQNTTTTANIREIIREESLEEEDDHLSFELFHDHKANLKKTQDSYIFLYIQMELCRRETLCHWLSTNLSREKKNIFKIFEQILSAITYIHSMNLIHRDLKPSNIFLSLDNQIKIGDFGLVIEMEQENEQLNGNKKVSNSKKSNNNNNNNNDGTLLYMSPEQLNGKEYDHKVDIYSLGVILFELIVSFQTQMERIETLKNLGRQKFPRNFTKEHSVEYDLISLLINKNPNERPNAKDVVWLEIFEDFKKSYYHD